MMKAANLVVYALLAIIGYLTFTSSQSLPEGLFGDIGAGAFPSILGLSLILLALVGGFSELKPTYTNTSADLSHLKQWFVMLFLLCAFITSWQLLGYFFIWLPLFLLISFCWFRAALSARNLIIDVMLSTGLTAGAYGLFVITLGIQFG